MSNSSIRQLVLIVCLALGLNGLTFAVELPGWTVPATWKKQDGEKPMRIATFNAGADATATEIAVSSFPGDAGGLFANVNRWRGQVGLQPVKKEEIGEVVQTFESDDFTGYTMRLKGMPNHMLGAIVYDQKQDRTWFVKATASPTAIDAHEADFVAFAKSFAK